MLRTNQANIYVAIVDDDEGVRSAFSRLLRAAGFQPVAYASAEAFLADTKHPQFDCLALDIQLTGLSGLDLGRRLAAVHQHTPIIYITAYDNEENRRQAGLLGCAGYFRKDARGQDIIERIRCVLGLDSKTAPGRTADSGH
ncbi:MAG: response regulator [Verrucomicrobiales bacterium]|nr:response regulator [Verrucomicrobiales bacterium]MCP5525881.1 response regulator [Verrucomicrobiales bacterium]